MKIGHALLLQIVSSPNQDTGSIGAKEKFARICGMANIDSTSNQSPKPLTFDQELCHYIQAAGDAASFRTFWTEHASKLPNLANIVRRISAIPATSISSEAAFSLSGYSCRKQRRSLASKSIRQSMMLKYRPYLDKLIEQMSN